MNANLFKMALGYTVDKTNWTRMQQQHMLFCREMVGFPELYDSCHRDYNDFAKVKSAWTKLALLRKKIYGDDEPGLKTTGELKEIWSDMIKKFEAVYREVRGQFVTIVGQPFHHNLKQLLKLGDEKLSYFSHMIFYVLYDENFNNLPAPKMICRGGAWLVVHCDGLEESLSTLRPDSRERLECEVFFFIVDMYCRFSPNRDRRSTMEYNNMAQVREMAKVNLDRFFV